jgi:transcriptional regulator with XRE-family HTH domain
MARSRSRVTNGPAILAKREMLGIPQKTLAERIGVSGSYLSRIENGVETPGLTSTAVRKLAVELGVSLEEITVPVEPVPV